MNKKLLSLLLIIALCFTSFHGFAVQRSATSKAAGAGENVLKFGNFNTASDVQLFLSNGARREFWEDDCAGNANSGCIKFTVNNQFGNSYIMFPNVIGETYDISFYAKADSEQSLEFIPLFEQGPGGWDTSILLDKFSTGWKQYQCTYYCDGLNYQGTENTSNLKMFGIRIAGGATGYTFYLDNISITPRGDVAYDWSAEDFSAGSIFYDDVIPADTGFAAPQPYEAVTFTDMTNHWGRSTVEALASAGMLKGKEDGSFSPDANITRAEFIQMAMNLLRYVDTPYRGAYNDVSASDWYANTVQAAHDIGLIPSVMTSDGSFKPNQNITRQEAAVVMSVLAKARTTQPEIEQVKMFTDNCRISSWAKDGVYDAVAYKLIEGYPDGKFYPKNEMTRAEAATIMSRTVEAGGRLAVYVDGENGRDTNDGTLNAPVKTVDAARKLVQPYLADMENHIFVYIKEGTYKINSSIYWGPEDSGQNGFSVIYKSLGDEQPVFDMSQEYTGFQPHDETKNIYKIHVGQNNPARQAFFNGVRGTRARSEFVARTGETPWTMVNYTYYECDDLSFLELTNPQEVELVFYENWTNPRLKIANIEKTAQGRVRFIPDDLKWNPDKKIGYTNGSTFPGEHPAYVENAYELITNPGEWYINKNDGYLYYKLRDYEDYKTLVVNLPSTEGGFFIAGKSPKEKIHNLKFDNLAFKYSAWNYPGTLALYKDHQAGELLNYPGDGRLTGSRETAAVTVADAAYVDITNCTFAHLGGSGLGFREIFQNCNISGNHIYDTSGSGLTLGAAVKEDEGKVFDIYFKPKTYINYRIYNKVNNNLIHDYGTDYKGSVGFHASPGLKESEICNNEIYSAPYTGMHIGWEWATRDIEGTGTRELKVENNYIHDVLNTWIYDGACMYYNGATGDSLADMTETDYVTIKGNYCENTSNGTAPIYLDNGTTYYEVMNNVVGSPDYTKDYYVCNNVGKTSDGPRWLYLQFDSHDNYVHDNWYLAPSYTKDTSGNASVLENNIQVAENESWPAEAQAVVDNAGLEADYLAKYPDSIQKIDLNGVEKISFMGTGEKATLNVRGTMRKMNKVNMTPDKLMFSSSDESIATVDKNGVITAVGTGKCYVYVDYLDGDVIRTKFVEVVSGDSVQAVAVDAESYTVASGFEALVTPTITTKFGGSVEIESTEYVVENPEVLTVSEDGVMTGLADGTTTVKGVYQIDNEVYEHEFPVTVYSYATEDSVKHIENSTKMTAGSFLSASGWSVGATKFEDGVKIAHSQPSYYKTKSENALYSFDLMINNPNTWPSIALKCTDINGDYTNAQTYLIGFKPDHFELQRFDHGKRTMLFGDASFNPIYGAGAPNVLNGETMFEYGKRYSVTVGTIDEEDGVRVVLIVNGKPVYDYLDTAEGHIKGSGYMGMYAFSGDFTILPFTDQRFEEQGE